MEHIIAAPADNTKAPEVSNERVTKQFNMQGLQTEYATANKWIAYLPIENVLGKKYRREYCFLCFFKKRTRIFDEAGGSENEDAKRIYRNMCLPLTAGPRRASMSFAVVCG